MSDLERGWVAGIIEGEGSLSVHPNNKGTLDENGEEKLYGRLGVEMVDEDVVRRLHEVTGIGRLYGPYLRPKARPSTKPIWRWIVMRRDDFESLGKEMIPLMGKRRAMKWKELMS